MSSGKKKGDFNPNELFADLRSIVFKVGLALGGLVLLRDLWRLLISPGRWIPFTLAGNRPELAERIVLPGFLGQIAVLNGVLEWLKNAWLFVSLPVAAILVVIVLYVLWNHVIVPVFHWISRLIILAWRGIRKIIGKPLKAKRHLVICIDGTWNFPEELEDGIIKSSNVYKFWEQLKGQRRKLRELTVGADLEKYYKVGNLEQIALYYPGVGNPATYSTLGTVVGGAFGFGAKTLRREAYRDIIRYLRSPETDRITIVGFSRGAAIARWLAGYIEEEGIPHLTLSDTLAGKFVVKLARKAMPWFGWIQKRPVDVGFLGVWDTVASFGLGKNLFGIPFQRINLFKDFSVSPSVRKVVHLVSLDEQRDAFLPTLVEPPKRKRRDKRPETEIDQLWFAGVHSNVGGGFLNDGLAMISLEYMTRKFEEHYQGSEHAVHLVPKDYGSLDKNIESPLRHSTGAIYEKVIRELPDDARLHKSVVAKMTVANLRYCPQNVSDLLERLKKKKEKTIADLTRLKDEGHITDPQLARFQADITQQCQMRIVS